MKHNLVGIAGIGGDGPGYAYTRSWFSLWLSEFIIIIIIKTI